MKKFVFSLQKVMGFKEQTLGLKKTELSQLQHQLIQLEKSIETIQHQYHETNENLVEHMKSGMLPGDISLTKVYLNQLDQQIQALEQNRHQLLEVIALKKREVLSVRTDISGLERLRDKQVEEYRKASQKEQELAIEEFVSHQR